mmetsp:Transcript_27217/g.68579  ORF Transcript_27217/g.68579 Transcript_27217/m.68579 type:complete len:669 (-) Transcript_27217:11-2017(-)
MMIQRTKSSTASAMGKKKSSPAIPDMKGGGQSGGSGKPATSSHASTAAGAKKRQGSQVGGALLPTTHGKGFSFDGFTSQSGSFDEMPHADQTAFSRTRSGVGKSPSGDVVKKSPSAGIFTRTPSNTGAVGSTIPPSPLQGPLTGPNAGGVAVHAGKKALANPEVQATFRTVQMEGKLQHARDKYGFAKDAEERTSSEVKDEHIRVEDDPVERKSTGKSTGSGKEAPSLVATLLSRAPERKNAGMGRASSSAANTVTSASITKLKFNASTLQERRKSQFDSKVGYATMKSHGEVELRESQEIKQAKKTVSLVYKALLGRVVDSSGMKHYTKCMTEDKLDRDGLIILLCKSAEFRERMLEKHRALPTRYRKAWDNPVYPWKATEDETDADAGTIQWVENPQHEKERLWQSGMVKGNNQGMEVFEGRLVYSTMDNWTSVCARHGFKRGVHWWAVTKLVRSPSGDTGRIGVMVRNCELDADLNKGEYFKDRAFYIDENGSLWNGDCFISNGSALWSTGAVVTMRLDCFAGEITFWVSTSIPGRRGGERREVPSEEELGTRCGCIKIPIKDKEGHVELFPFVQDMFGGSGWSVSHFETEEPEELADKEAFVQSKALEAQKKMGVRRGRSTSVTSTDAAMSMGGSRRNLKRASSSGAYLEGGSFLARHVAANDL